MKNEKETFIGLAQNKDNTRFECGTCEHFRAGLCMHKNPKLFRKSVDRRWCCNLYEHPGMKVIIG